MRELEINASLLLELTQEQIDIDSLVDRLDDRHAFDGIEADEIFRSWKKSQVRRSAKRLKGADGFPLIFSIAEVGRDGKAVRKYKQELLFNIEEYRQAIEQYRRGRLRFQKIEKWLIERARDTAPATAPATATAYSQVTQRSTPRQKDWTP